MARLPRTGSAVASLCERTPEIDELVKRGVVDPREFVTTLVDTIARLGLAPLSPGDEGAGWPGGDHRPWGVTRILDDHYAALPPARIKAPDIFGSLIGRREPMDVRVLHPCGFDEAAQCLHRNVFTHPVDDHHCNVLWPIKQRSHYLVALRSARLRTLPFAEMPLLIDADWVVRRPGKVCSWVQVE
jgi:hypothetical protein